MAKLDKKRDHGTIHGDIEGRHFEQDGKFFDAKGDEISAKQAADNKKVADKVVAEKAAEEAAAQVAKQAAGR